MSDTKEISAVEAIRQVIADTGALDYVDIVNAVHKRFRIGVTAAQVEQVYHDLTHETAPKPQARTSVTLTSMMADPAPTAPAVAPSSPQQPHHPSSSNDSTPGAVGNEFGRAVDFVKSVGGLANAKRLLNDLESVLAGGD